MRHELVHACHQLGINSGIFSLVDDQDERQRQAQVYFTADNKLKEQIEIDNLQDVKIHWNETQPNKTVGLVKSMLQSVISLLGLIIGLKKKKPSKEWVIEQFVQGHAQFEGFYKEGTIAKLYNNPGCLKFANQAKATKTPNGFAIFETPQDRWNALREQVKLNLSGNSSLYDINQDFYSYVYVYASTSPDVEKVAYAEFLAKQVGVSPNTKLKDLW